MLNLMAVLVITRAHWYQGLHLGCCGWDHLNQFGSCGLYCGVNAAEVMVIRLVLKEAISLELNPLIEGACLALSPGIVTVTAIFPLNINHVVEKIQDVLIIHIQKRARMKVYT